MARTPATVVSPRAIASATASSRGRLGGQALMGSFSAGAPRGSALPAPRLAVKVRVTGNAVFGNVELARGDPGG